MFVNNVVPCRCGMAVQLSVPWTNYFKSTTAISTFLKLLLKKKILLRKPLTTYQVQSTFFQPSSELHVLSLPALELLKSTSSLSQVLTKSVSQFTPDERLHLFSQRSLRKAGVQNISGMDATILWPPEHVRGMTELDEAAFQKTIKVPTAKVCLTHIAPALKVLKKYFLKLRNFNAIEEGPAGSDYKVIHLNPLSMAGNEAKVLEEIEKACKKYGKEWNSSEKCPIEFGTSPVALQYKNWTASETLSAVLPLDQNGVSGYSIIGHIIHLNLKEHLDPYKKIIGRILLDKSPCEVTMVVNKVDTIDNSDNTFRCFSMEILAGTGDTVATIKENMCRFTFDFAKVYWNPRLSTEHETIVSMLRSEDVLYDVMAGVGPFSIPAAVQKKCQVLCNDLNPESFRWLTHNIALNKVSDRVVSHNLDGGEFIRTVLKEDLLRRWKDPEFSGQLHVTMNLPSISVEFLTNFVGLMSDVDDRDLNINCRDLCVHVYMFSKDQKASSCATRVAFYLGLVDHLPDFDGEFSEKLDTIVSALNQGSDKSKLQEHQECLRSKFVKDEFDIPGLVVKEVRFVRKVAPNKAMVRLSVVVGRDILLKNRAVSIQAEISSEGDTRTSKKIKLDAE